MKSCSRWYLLVALLLAGLTAATLPAAADISSTKHNLSASGPGPIKALNEDELCIFCHTPHKARQDVSYLWNRADSDAVYIPYQSSTLYATVGQPTGASKLCLSCHDGTIAIGMLLSRSQEVEFVGGLRFMPNGTSLIGTDLSTSHPVSLVYDAALAGRNLTLNDPALLPAAVHLDSSRQLQCTACHEPHDNSYGKFLVMSNRNSALCMACHNVPGWGQGSHSTSGAVWNGTGVTPWPDSPYTTTSENGCNNCHKSHSAGGKQRLLNYAAEEDNCLVCHNGNVARSNIGAELTRMYRHGVQNSFGIHDPVEDFSAGRVAQHVECVDCHSPHASNAGPKPAFGDPPLVSGATQGVRGIDIYGTAVQTASFGYEICLKCHGDTQMGSTLPITRQIDQRNVRLKFNPANPSFHPVASNGINPNVPSLLAPLTTLSRVDCISCHNNSNPVGPLGPHGSDYPRLLKQQYDTADATIESSAAYSLCYQCHNRLSIIGNASFPTHSLHVVTQQTPCSACHDPHGISVTQGTSLTNSHLINFDLDIVKPDSQGRLRFEDQGVLHGQCFLNCHGVAHEPKVY